MSADPLHEMFDAKYCAPEAVLGPTPLICIRSWRVRKIPSFLRRSTISLPWPRIRRSSARVTPYSGSSVITSKSFDPIVS